MLKKRRANENQIFFNKNDPTGPKSFIKYNKSIEEVIYVKYVCTYVCMVCMYTYDIYIYIYFIITDKCAIKTVRFKTTEQGQEYLI